MYTKKQKLDIIDRAFTLMEEADAKWTCLALAQGEREVLKLTDYVDYRSSGMVGLYTTVLANTTELRWFSDIQDEATVDYICDLTVDKAAAEVGVSAHELRLNMLALFYTLVEDDYV